MKSSKAPAPATKGKTLADFRAAHDKNVIVPTKIKNALDALAKENPENWVYEQELIKRAGISTTDLAVFRESFAAHIVEVGTRNAKRVWFATAKVAAKVRAA